MAGLLCAAHLSNAQTEPENKRGSITPEDFPWLPASDTIEYGVNNIAIQLVQRGNELKLDFELSAPQTVYVYVYNVYGHLADYRKLKLQPRTLRSEQLLVRNLSAGFYVLLIEAKGQRLVRKILIP